MCNNNPTFAQRTVHNNHGHRSQSITNNFPRQFSAKTIHLSNIPENDTFPKATAHLTTTSKDSIAIYSSPTIHENNCPTISIVALLFQKSNIYSSLAIHKSNDNSLQNSVAINDKVHASPSTQITKANLIPNISLPTKFTFHLSTLTHNFYEAILEQANSVIFTHTPKRHTNCLFQTQNSSHLFSSRMAKQLVLHPDGPSP